MLFEKTDGANRKFVMKGLGFINKVLSKLGWKLIPGDHFEFDAIAKKLGTDAGVKYIENEEVGSKNFSEKMARVRNNEPFEWPNMVALNEAIATFIGDAKKIVSVGAGTGTFEWHASVDSSLQLVASEFDEDCVKWCKENRQRDNIHYCSKSMEEIAEEHGRFDLAVAVDVIEHVKDYPSFLDQFSRLAPRAIITTPNKSRSYESLIASSPPYYQHVREWTAGEFYWVLRTFYSKVDIFAMPDVYVPNVEKIGLLSTMTPLIAVCEQ